MSSRLLSSNTLVDGMNAVGFKGSKPDDTRKRELEAQIEARSCVLSLSPLLS
jgi:hypothetical protein